MDRDLCLSPLFPYSGFNDTYACPELTSGRGDREPENRNSGTKGSRGKDRVILHAGRDIRGGPPETKKELSGHKGRQLAGRVVKQWTVWPRGMVSGGHSQGMARAGGHDCRG